MKIYRIMTALFLVFSCASVLADSRLRSEKDSAYQDHYGIVNAIYSDESRIVIDDVSLLYKHGSAFINAQGRRFSGIKKAIKPGVAVKYHYYQQSANLVLKDIKLISMSELNKLRTKNSQMY